MSFESNAKELLLGAGSNKTKKVYIEGNEGWSNLVTLDFNGDHAPDVVWDLEKLPLPFTNSEFSEIHAYDVLEHTGGQGDWKFFFDQWSEFYRILQPGGLFFLRGPSWKSQWAWGDPSHKRLITAGSLMFLSQEEYEKQVGKSPMSDFRFYWKGDFRPIYISEDEENLVAVLRSMKGVE